MIDYFGGNSSDRLEELDERRLKRPLVKTHLLEIMSGDGCSSPDELTGIFQRRGVKLEPIEDDLFLLPLRMVRGSDIWKFETPDFSILLIGIIKNPYYIHRQDPI